MKKISLCDVCPVKQSCSKLCVPMEKLLSQPEATTNKEYFHTEYRDELENEGLETKVEEVQVLCFVTASHRKRVRDLLNSPENPLTRTQTKYILLLLETKSITKIAEQYGKNKVTVYRSLEKAKNRLKKYFNS